MATVPRCRLELGFLRLSAAMGLSVTFEPDELTELLDELEAHRAAAAYRDDVAVTEEQPTRSNAGVALAVVTVLLAALAAWWSTETRWWYAAAVPLAIIGVAGLATELSRPR